MSDHSFVLVLSNDLSANSTKISRHLCLALKRLGFAATCRDTRLIRWAAVEVEKEGPARRETYEAAVVAKWNAYISDYGIDTIISLDLHWLFSTQLFVDNDRVKQIHSFWLDDVRSQLESDSRFPLAPHTLLELINKPKVSHHCLRQGQADEFRLLGVERIFPPVMETPAEFLRAGGSEEDFWKLMLTRALA
jgi:hypothetical protein